MKPSVTFSVALFRLIGPATPSWLYPEPAVVPLSATEKVEVASMFRPPLSVKTPGAASPGCTVPEVESIEPTVPVPSSVAPAATVTGLFPSFPSTWRMPALTAVVPV